NLNNSAKFDLYLNAVKRAHQIELVWECNKELIDAQMASRITSYFPDVLEWMVVHAEERISELSLLTEAERRQIVYDWNETDLAYDRQSCLHQLVSGQAKRTPGAVAVIYEHQRVSYEELERQANQIAHQLRAVGIGRGDFVGIYLSRSAEMVAALLGVLKAGAAYVPLELSYPMARVQWILSSMKVRAILTQSWHLPALEEIGPALEALQDVIGLDEGSQEVFISPEQRW